MCAYSLTASENIDGSISQLLRYVLVGILNNSAGFLVYWLLTHFGGTPKLTMTTLYVFGALIGYMGNRKFTFAYEGSIMGSGFRYLIAHFFGYLIDLVLLIIFVDYYMYPHQLVQGVAIFIVAGFLFMAFKFFVFKNFKLSKES